MRVYRDSALLPVRMSGLGAAEVFLETPRSSKVTRYEQAPPSGVSVTLGRPEGGQVCALQKPARTNSRRDNREFAILVLCVYVVCISKQMNAKVMKTYQWGALREICRTITKSCLLGVK